MIPDAQVVEFFPKRQVMDLLAKRDVYDIVIAAEIGSKAMGVQVSRSDRDYMIIRFESWHEFVNGPGDRQSMQIRSAPDGQASGEEDIDLNIYTLRKFSHMAMSGNPFVLSALWTPNTWLERDGWKHYKAEMQNYLPARSAGKAFLGVMYSQMTKFLEQKGNRSDLVRNFGFDTKAASKVIEAGHQGCVFMETGALEIPISEPTAAEIRSLRTGGYTEVQALEWAKDLEKQLKEAITRSVLPETPNTIGIHHLVASTYGTHYSSTLR